jgi:hypothetical protein
MRLPGQENLTTDIRFSYWKHGHTGVRIGNPVRESLLNGFPAHTVGKFMATITLLLNGTERKVEAGEGESLLSVLRNRLGLTGTKYGLRSGPMRRLHGAAGWKGSPLLQVAGRIGQGQQGGHH